MSQKTAGELKRLYWVAETTYGSIPTGALSWGADCISLKPKINFHNEPHILEGSRSFGEVTRDSYEVGFVVRGIARESTTGYDWRNLWAKYAFGETSGTPALAEHLSSFTAQTGTRRGTASDYNFYNGCKINSLTISSEKPGSLLEFEAEVYAQWITLAESKTISSGMQQKTIGADPSPVTSPVLTWNSALTLNSNTIHPDSWKFTVTNNLQRRYGIVVGDDSVVYPVAISLEEGIREIVVEMEMPYESTSYQLAKMSDSAVSMTIPIGGVVLNLQNGRYIVDDDAMPEYRQDLMTESIRLRFSSLSI